jgi:hypothetical protein
MAKEKLSISIDSKLSGEIQKYAKSKHLSTSKLIENVLINWKKENFKKEMIEGYKSMANENLELVKEFESLNNEAWPNE